MIVDTSAIMAILLCEPEEAKYFDILSRVSGSKISAGTYIELSIVTARRQPAIPAELVDKLLDMLAISIEPVTVEQATLARQAYRIYGRGIHPAALNFGDCFAYALAKSTGRPLLYKGDDFAQTDVRAAE